MKPSRVLVPVPVEVALVYDGRTWQLLPAPPQWWLDERERDTPAAAPEAVASRRAPALAERCL